MSVIIVFIFSQVVIVGKQDAKKISAATVIETTLNASGVEAAYVKFREIYAQKECYSIIQSEFLELGVHLLRDGKTQSAAAVLRMTVEFFPDSDQAYLVLGQAYRSLGLNDMDLESTNRSFELRNARKLAEFISENKNSLAQSAEQVIDRYLDVIGGKEKLKKIKTIRMLLTRLDSINRETDFIRYFKYPNYYRQTVVPEDLSTVTDGRTVWRVSPKGWNEIPQSNFKYAPDIYGDFIDYKKKGISYSLLGIECIDLQVMYRLLKTYQDGHTIEYYFSAESGLFVMERRDFGIGKDIKQYFDWREVGGILFPHLFVVTNKIGLGNAHGGIIKEITLNEPLDDSLFRHQ